MQRGHGRWAGLAENRVIDSTAQPCSYFPSFNVFPLWVSQWKQEKNVGSDRPTFSKAPEGQPGA